MRYVLGAMFLYRACLYAMQERDFSDFDIKKGAKIRGEWTRISEEYIRKDAPRKVHGGAYAQDYHCLQEESYRYGYLACMHRSNEELISDNLI